MSILTEATSPFARRSRELGLGFLFWLTFLLALEPGNVMRAHGAGLSLAWDRELVRIIGAAAIGALSAPVVFALVRAFPVEGRHRWRNLALHAAGAIALAVALVAVSCLLAALLGVGNSRFVPVLLSNGLLLAFCIAALAGLAHLLPRKRASASVVSPYLARLPVKQREGQTWIDLAQVDWIEAQGNYLALHAGEKTHLVRMTLANLERGLDPDRFVRIHRGTIVALDRVTTVGRPANGDATVSLSNGVELKLSRSYRAKLRARLDLS